MKPTAYAMIAAAALAVAACQPADETTDPTMTAQDPADMTGAAPMPAPADPTMAPAPTDPGATVTPDGAPTTPPVDDPAEPMSDTMGAPPPAA